MDGETTTDTIEKTEYMPRYKVLLHNDDKNEFAYVVSALVLALSIKTDDSLKIVEEAHVKGVALCKVTSFERAEFYTERLQSCSLTATMEPE